jgi:hypothetical protein
MPNPNAPNDLLAVTRLKIDLLISQYADRRKVFVVENRVKGASAESLKAQAGKDFSKWSMDWLALGKSIKRECAGLVNSAFMKAYLGGYKAK